MNLVNGLTAKNLIVVKSLVNDLAPNGIVNFERIYQECSSIALVKKINGSQVTVTFIYILIEDCNKALNVFSPMSQYQMMDLAEDILIDLEGYTLEDMAIFFAGIKRGYWGQVKSRFDAAIVWDMWAAYSTQRQDHFYRKETQHKAHEISEKRSGQLFLEQGIKDNLKQINKAWAGKKS